MFALISSLEFRTTTTSRSGSVVFSLIDEMALFSLGMFFARVGTTAKTFAIWALQENVSVNLESIRATLIS